MEWFLEGLKSGVQQMTWLEAIAVFFGLLSVWYSMRRDILVFPTGIVSTIIFVYICFPAKLYADMAINVYYTAMSVYGWILWSKKNPGEEALPVSYNSRNENVITAFFLIGSFVFWYYILTQHTDSDVPLWDSLTTAIFIVGMWLMAKKKVENWIAWILGDLISVPLYFYKGLLLASFQFFIFTIIAVVGLVAWINDVKQQKKEAV
ncbi:MAG: nicotinamide riboside transporter PnuC [Imperialibacter sp.]|uniref:nicotinamide riboside transporter PnuC n=1 Tax=Imperialibacter sp. TaxID=2038411 RepID=UPI0032EAF57A